MGGPAPRKIARKWVQAGQPESQILRTNFVRKSCKKEIHNFLGGGQEKGGLLWSSKAWHGVLCLNFGSAIHLRFDSGKCT